MIKLNNFKATKEEFKQIARVENLIRHDSICHPDYLEEGWKIKDNTIIKDKILLYDSKKLIGVLHYCQGRKENNRNTYFTIYLDPIYNGKGYRKKLYDKMLDKINIYNSNKLFPYIFDHPNYLDFKNFLINNNFILVQTNREYSLDLTKFHTDKYLNIFNTVKKDGIFIYESRDEMKSFPNHYKKLEQLSWEISKDYPMPDGIIATRIPFDQAMKIQTSFEKYSYGIQLVAVKDEEYVGTTSLSLFKKSDPNKAWTEGLGVVREFRRKGIATALKIKAIQILQQKGVREIRTDNEENNPMYKINVNLGFKPVPFSLEYMKKIQ